MRMQAGISCDQRSPFYRVAGKRCTTALCLLTSSKRGFDLYDLWHSSGAFGHLGLSLVSEENFGRSLDVGRIDSHWKPKVSVSSLAWVPKVSFTSPIGNFYSDAFSIDQFLSRVSILTRDIDIANLSVRPFVRLSVRPSVCPLRSVRYLIKTA